MEGRVLDEGLAVASILPSPYQPATSLDSMSGPDEPTSSDWSALRWILLGLAGIALAAAIGLAAANLVHQPVGLTGEPVSAGSALEPATGTPGRTVPKTVPSNPPPKQGSVGPRGPEAPFRHHGHNYHRDDHHRDGHHRDDRHPGGHLHGGDGHHRDDDD